MDIEEVKRKRTKLELDIAKLLLEFNQETGLEVAAIRITDKVVQLTPNGERVARYIVRADVTL